MKTLMPYLPLLIPIVIIELTLMILALRHVLKHRTYRFGNRAFWIVVVMIFQIIGPVLYFTVGRGDN